MAEMTTQQDMTVNQGGGGTAAPAAEANNPFAAFKNEVSSGEQERLDAATAAKTAADAAKPAAAAEVHENVIDGEEIDDEGQEGSEEAAIAPAPAAGKSKFQARIDALRRGKTEAETRAERAERELAEERAKKPDGKKPAAGGSTTDAKSWKTDPTAPKAEEFPFGEVDPDFIVALSDWRNAQHDARRAEEQKAASARSAAEAEVSKQNAQWDTRAEAAVAKYPDFVDVVYATIKGENGKELPAWPASAEMSRLIKRSEQGPDVAYYLAKNPTEARRIAALPVVEQAVEFGTLKAKFASPPKPKGGVTGAPPPPKETATGKGGTPPSASSSSDFAAFEKQVKAQTAAKHAGR